MGDEAAPEEKPKGVAGRAPLRPCRRALRRLHCSWMGKSGPCPRLAVWFSSGGCGMRVPHVCNPPFFNPR